MSAEYHEGQNLLKEVGAKLKPSHSFWGSLFHSSKPDHEEISELYVKAGNAFKAGKYWDDAADAYLKAAETDVKYNERDEAARKYVMAANVYKKIDAHSMLFWMRSSFVEAVECLQSAVQIFIKAGRFHMAATNEKDVAELYEGALEQPEQAMKWYERAADRYSAENSPAISQSLILRVANLAARQGQLGKATGIFEDVAHASINDTLQKYSVRDYLFRAGLCRLANTSGDLSETKRKILGYASLDPAFAQSREYTLLQDILDSLEEDDLEKFITALSEFDKVHSLDEWKTRLLGAVKSRFQEEPDLT